MKVVTAEQMRRIDQITIAERGVPGLTLMERAGRAVARDALERFHPDSAIVLAGRGNNGGDGFIAARYLHQAGVPCWVILFADPKDLKGDALAAWEAIPPQISRESRNNAAGLAEELRRFDLVIDALLGTGTRGPVKGLLGEVIEAINAARLPVLAVDIPSGLPADGHPPEGPCVRAASTVTMGLPKYGMLVQPGVRMTGVVVTEDLGFPPDLLNDPAIQLHVTGPDEVRPLLPPRAPDGNKGTFGKLLVLCGSVGMSGAAVMAAQAAGRSGAGLVYAGVLEKLMPVFDLHLIEAVKKPIRSATGGHFDQESIEDALAAAEEADAVVLGPGLSTREGVAQFVRALCERCSKPMLIDADGLNVLADNPAVLRKRPAPTLITPHPGEMGRLNSTSAKDVQANRLAAATAFAREHGVAVLLKGAQTLIARPDGQAFINPSGNSGLAKGGSGDILAGLIGGLMAQGADAFEAGVAGAFLHGVAGDLAAREIGIRAMTPLDLLKHFGGAFKMAE